MKEITKNYQLNHFSARKVLGSGAYGKVILVTHEKLNIHFALKCISKKPLIKPKHITFIKVLFIII
jgi:serine/threonine protein kinase